MKLSDYKALTFDCYGTLIDWESGIIAGLRPLTGRVGRPLGRDAILQAHARHESSQQAWTPTTRYADLLPVVYKRLAEDWGVPVSAADCEAYGRSVADWPAFPDSAAALRYLKQHYKLVILSNIDNASFAASHDKLGVAFDAIYTAEDIGSYKPSDRNFEYMLQQLPALGIARQDVLHTAESLFHDHIPARRHGLANCWIHRRHDQDGFGATMAPGDPGDPGAMPAVDFRFDSMAGMAAAHRAEQAG